MGLGQKLPGSTRERLRTRYDELWSDSIGRIRAGTIDLDLVLAARGADQRRGLSVMARPSAAVRQRVLEFLKEMRRLEPEQYYYLGSEFHVTVLSMFTATVNHRPFLAQKARYAAAVQSVLQHAPPVPIDFEGVTASAGGVMIQGFLRDDSLNELRDALRNELRNCGLGGELDQRYRLHTAHMTVVRFRAPLVNSGRFARALQRARQRPFGATVVKTCSMVEGDWYMSRPNTRIVQRYRLAGSSSR
jgi:2'-5' RNA ligase